MASLFRTPPANVKMKPEASTFPRGSLSPVRSRDLRGNGLANPRFDDDNNLMVPLKESDCWSELGYSFSKGRKWLILTIVFLVQVSMNLNASLYSNGQKGIAKRFKVSLQAARCGAAIFLITYAFGCELWAPWSEEFGRKIVLQASLTLVSIFALPVALAPNFATVLVGRALGGLSTAGGSVTLAVVADLFVPDEQGHAVAFIVFSSVGGSIIGPIIGGFIETYLSWKWCTWIQIIFSVFVQLLHIFLVPETRSTVMLDNIAKQRRKDGIRPGPGMQYYGPCEMAPKRIHWRDTFDIWMRPFRMFVTEPIVLFLSLLSGFADGLIFMQIQAFAVVYQQYGFSAITLGLAFIPIGVGYLLAYMSFLPVIGRNKALRAARPGDERAQYEERLWWLLWTMPCLPIGVLMFGFTAAWADPPVHCIGSMISAGIIGVANYSIYMATIDYMVAAYGPYAASATGGNGWARDIIAGILTVPATPFYENIGEKPVFNANMIIFGVSLVLTLFVYWIYWKGPELRKRSKFAQSLRQAEDEGAAEGPPVTGNVPPDGPVSHRLPVIYLPPSSMPGSRAASRQGSRATTPRASPAVSRKTSMNLSRERLQLAPLSAIVSQKLG